MLRLGKALSILLALMSLCAATAVAESVTLDGQGAGLTFDGIGGLSAGAGTRLLFDYPEAQQAELLDQLFKPNYGAALHHLKVEIGGDVNSTEGSEPSYARTREEFEHPRPEYFDRGYEWRLMREAKKRNPKIFLDVLQWGAPDWIGDKDYPDKGDANALSWQQRVERNRKKFYTQDNADFIAGFINGAKTYHNLDIDYCGIWNETRYDVPWIKLLRKTLDARGLGRIGIIADDGFGWEFAEEVAKDAELKKILRAVGNHYSGYQSTDTAKQLGMTLWASEDHAGWARGWAGARALAKQHNRNYIEGRMTKTVFCYLIAAYCRPLAFPDCAGITSNTPWSGHYTIWPAHWTTAHTTQFAQPGWRYLDAGCGLLKEGGSYVTLRSPEAAGDYSIIIETGDAKTPQAMTLKTTGGLAAGALHVFHSDAKSQFDRLEDILPVNGSFTITLQPDSVYSLTTTTGQRKGAAEIPLPAEFPIPYGDDFESYAAGKTPRYLSDQSGTFEVAARADGGKCLRQTVARHGIDWNGYPTPEPYTIVGSEWWHNYEVSCDANLEGSGYVALFGRIRNSLMSHADPPHGYWLKVSGDGRWELKSFNNTLKSGTVAFAADVWHKLAMRFSGSQIVGVVDGVEVVNFTDAVPYFEHGVVGVGTGWNTAAFDNLAVREISGPPSSGNLALGKLVTTSSIFSHGYAAYFAADGDIFTRWNSAPDDTDGCWVEVDFGAPTEFDAVSVRQFEKRIDKYKIQYFDGTEWKDAFAGAATDDFWKVRFDPVRGTKMRLLMETTKGHVTPSIYELGVYHDGK